MITDINSEDRLVQPTFAEFLKEELDWESVYAWNNEAFGPDGTLGPVSERDVVLVRDVRAALARLNPELSESVREQAVEKLTRIDLSRSINAILLAHDIVTPVDGLRLVSRDQKSNWAPN